MSLSRTRAVLALLMVFVLVAGQTRSPSSQDVASADRLSGHASAARVVSDLGHGPERFRLIEMLEVVAQGTYKGDYRLHAASGEFVPAEWDDPLRAYFSLE